MHSIIEKCLRYSILHISLILRLYKCRKMEKINIFWRVTKPIKFVFVFEVVLLCFKADIYQYLAGNTWDPPQGRIRSHPTRWQRCINTALNILSHHHQPTRFLASTAALDVQMLVCVCITLATTLMDFWRTSKRLPKDSEGLSKDYWRSLDFMVYKIN